MPSLTPQSKSNAPVLIWLLIFPDKMQLQQNHHASFSCLLIHQHSTVAFAYKLSACFNLRKSPNGSESQLTRKLKNCSIRSPVDFKQVLTSSNHSDILWGERSNKNKRWEFAWPQTDVPQPHLGSSLLWSVDGASGFCAAAKSVGRYWYPFPLSLLSCFAFRGFALSPECPACGL